MNLLTDTFSSSIMQRALLEALMAGALCGVVGVHVVLRRLSFFAMALTHATFPGVVLAAILGVSLFFGTAAFGLVVVAVIAWLGLRDQLDSSTAIGVVLAGGFALGVVLISAQPGFTRDLTGFLVGSILAVQSTDLAVTAGAVVVVLVLILVPHKELVLGAFDRSALEAQGYPVVVLDVIVLVAIELTVVTSIQAMGTVLSIALIVAPAAAARLWTDRIWVTMVLAALFGAGSGFVGLVVSKQLSVAAGPSIALTVSGVFALSLLVAPTHGLVARLRTRSGVENRSHDRSVRSPTLPVTVDP